MSNKKRIIAYQNGRPVGYVKSVSYKKGTFTLTQDKAFAKTYSRDEKIMGDIDIISFEGLKNGMSFIMD